MTAHTADAVQRLIDRCDVSDAFKRYCFAIDWSDWALLRSTLADEFVFVNSLVADSGASKTPDEFVDDVRARTMAFDGSLHLNPDHLVTVDGDRAHIDCYMDAHHWIGAGADEIHIRGIGHYHVDLIRADDGWKLSRLRLAVAREEGSPEIWQIAERRRSDAASPDPTTRSEDAS